jgi:hypothetical protein
MLYFTPIRSKHDYASDWNSIMSAGANNLRRSAEVCSSSFQSLLSPYPLQLNFCFREHLAQKEACSSSLKFTLVLNSVMLFRFLARYVRNFSKFNVCSSEDWPSVRCASAAKVVCRDVDVFRNKTVPLKYCILVL